MKGHTGSAGCDLAGGHVEAWVRGQGKIEQGHSGWIKLLPVHPVNVERTLFAAAALSYGH